MSSVRPIRQNKSWPFQTCGIVISSWKRRPAMTLAELFVQVSSVQSDSVDRLAVPHSDFSCQRSCAFIADSNFTSFHEYACQLLQKLNDFYVFTERIKSVIGQ